MNNELQKLTLEEAIPLLKGWWSVNGFEVNGTIEGQFRKLIEEIHELFTALKNKDEKKIRDALGDIQVVCVMGCFILENKIKGGSFEVFISVEYEIALAIEAFLAEPLFALRQFRLVAKAMGFDPDECLAQAWNEIKDRRGHWENGVFVKHLPTPPETIKLGKEGA